MNVCFGTYLHSLSIHFTDIASFIVSSMSHLCANERVKFKIFRISETEHVWNENEYLFKFKVK